MSVPTQYGPSQQPGGGGGRIVLIVLLGVGCMSLLCCGGLALLGALFFTRLRATADRVQSSIQERVQPPLVARRWENDWIVMSQLTPVFTAALDAVATDKQVLERLGAPIETAGDSDALFRRERKDRFSGAGETLEFDIAGPQGTAVVRVDTGMQAQPRKTFGVWPRTITVTLTDGTQIDVPPPAEKQR